MESKVKDIKRTRIISISFLVVLFIGRMEKRRVLKKN